MFRRQFVRYLIVGAAGTLTHLLIMAAAVELASLSVTWGTVLGYLGALSLSFAFNYRWTFASSRAPLATFCRYTAVSLSGLLLNVLMVNGLVGLLGIWYLTAQLSVIWVVPVTNYLLSRYWAF
ncbi:MAG: GtrA family protein [Gammaproteobacteria bacterium]|nr:GtrA family protein [Gammaproteobacteria bacterium]